MILAPLQKMPKNVGDLGKLIVAKGFKKSPKVQKIANSGHTGQGISQRHLSNQTADWFELRLLSTNNKNGASELPTTKA